MWFFFVFVMVYLFYYFFDKKLLVLLILEGLTIFIIFLSFSNFSCSFFSVFLLVFLSVFMVLESVFSVSLLISCARNSSILNSHFMFF